MSSFLGTKLIGIKSLFCDMAKEKNMENKKAENAENKKNKI